jgi:hypothetical protein
VTGVGQAAGRVDKVAHLLRCSAAGNGPVDEEPDDLALGGPDLLADDGQAGRQPAQGEGALGGVVVGEPDAVQSQLSRPGD